MMKRMGNIGKRVALGVTAALIAVIAVTAIGQGPEAAHAVNIDRGWCVFEGPDGKLEYFDADTKVSGINIFTDMDKWCEEKKDGAHLTNKQKERIDNPPGNFLVPQNHASKDFPPGWFRSLPPCSEPLLQSGDVLDNTLGLDNRIEDVLNKRGTELGVQIAYDVGSNEVTGITGAIIGAILGVVKADTFATEWKYEVQDECQEIVERNTIQDISVDTQRIITDVKTLLVDVSTRASQTSVDAVDAKVVLISTALAALATSLTTETDEIDAALATLATSLTTETDEIDAALAAFKSQLVANQDQNLRLLIEEHLQDCTVLASMLLSDGGGLLPLAVLVVDDMADRAEVAGLDINSARRHMALADERIAAGNVRRGVSSLCTAYTQIVDGR